MSKQKYYCALWIALLCCFQSVNLLSTNSLYAMENQLTPESTDYYVKQIQPVLIKFCGDCHAVEDTDNHVRFLHNKTRAEINSNRGIWKSVIEQLRNRTMPPADDPQPEEELRLNIANWLETMLREEACSQGATAAPVVTRRLNRNEYEYVIQDCLEIKLPLMEMFPADGSGGEGFDNNGETLFVPPILMERYLEAAELILNKLVITPALKELLTAERFGIKTSDQRISLESQKSINTVLKVFREADYILRLKVSTNSQDQKVILKIDGLPVNELVEGDYQLQTAPKGDKAKEEKRLVAPVFHLVRGEHSIEFVNSSDSKLIIEQIVLEELAGLPKPEDVARHKKLLAVEPGTWDNVKETEEVKKTQREAAEKIVKNLGRRLFRRSLSEDEIATYLRLYERANSRHDPWEERIKLALKGMLVSPKFLFRTEAAPESEKLTPLSAHEVANRLAAYLWCSCPDDELLKLAESGKLLQDDVYRAQITRMIVDKKSARMSEHFVGQWLGTHEVAKRIIPAVEKFKGEFTTDLLIDMRREPVQLFDEVVQKDLDLMTLFTADYVIVTEALAKHYELKTENKGEKSSRFADYRPVLRIEGTHPQRGGIICMGGVHLLTSYPDRTSPVLRGGWVLETLTGIKIPAPPPDVPSLPGNKKKDLSLKEQLAKHRDHAACAACHNLIDPVGFALDNYDVLGRWRVKEGKFEIDAVGVLPTGETIPGPEGLRKVLLREREKILRHLTQKMLGYALGRSLEDSDDCTINQIMNKLAEGNYTSRVLLTEIALSIPFRNQQMRPEVQHTQEQIKNRKTKNQRKVD